MFVRSVDTVWTAPTGAKEDGSELHVSMWSILKQCSRKKYTAQKYRQNETTNKMLRNRQDNPRHGRALRDNV